MVSAKCQTRLASPQDICGNRRKEMGYRMCRSWQLIDEKKIGLSEAMLQASAEIRAQCQIEGKKSEIRNGRKAT